MTMFIGWLAIAAAAAAPCPPEGGDGCVVRGDRAAKKGRAAVAERWFRRACTPVRPDLCGRLLPYDDAAAKAVVEQASPLCADGNDAICRRLAGARGPEGPRPLRDYRVAVQSLAKACERSDGASCVKVAELLTTVDPDLAFDAAGARAWLERGCKAEHGPSCKELAWKRVRGAGGPVDGTGAIEALHQACELEVEGACRDLAQWWAWGRGVEPREDKAVAAWGRACTQGADDCLWGVRYLVEDEPEVSDTPIREAAVAQCNEGSDAACGAVLMLGLDGLQRLGVREHRQAALRKACSAEHAPSCAALAEGAEAPVARQLQQQVTWLAARQAADTPITVDSVPTAWLPDPGDTKRCVVEGITALASDAHQGRHSPSPGQERAASWLEAKMEAVGLQVQRQPVDVRRRGLSWVEVRGVRYPALPAPGSASGTFDGRVHVVDGPPAPGTIPADAEAVLVAVGRLSEASAPSVLADIPVLAVHRNVAALARAQRVLGVSRARRRGDVAHNIVGVLPGRGALAAESVVVGAHYDAQGSDAQGTFRPGADDNASGTASVVCVASALARALEEHDQRRTYVFVGFTGEELGLYGSRAYPWAPAHPNPVAMINLDMVGRVRDGEIQARLWGEGWRSRIASAAPAAGLRPVETPFVQGSSDHVPFAALGVPAVHFFSGTHGDYHRPTDTIDRVNMDGVAAVARLAGAMAASLAEGPVALGPIEDPCTELTVSPLRVGLDVGFMEGFRRLGVRCVAPGFAGEALGVQVGDVLHGVDAFRNRWPHEPATLYVERGSACYALRLGEPAKAVPCESMPD